MRLLLRCLMWGTAGLAVLAAVAVAGLIWLFSNGPHHVVALPDGRMCHVWVTGNAASPASARGIMVSMRRPWIWLPWIEQTVSERRIPDAEVTLDMVMNLESLCDR